MAKLAFATFQRILKESHKGIRVADDAAMELIEVMDIIAKDIAVQAHEFARHANRRTIMKDDVKLAAKKWLEKR